MAHSASRFSGRQTAMTEKELLKLNKSEMLEIMLAQSREIDSLREQLAEAEGYAYGEFAKVAPLFEEPYLEFK